MKYLIKTFIILILSFLVLWSTWADFTIPWVDKIDDVSITTTTTWDIQNDVNNIWKSLLQKAKVVIQWILVILIVFIGIQMIISMWNDDEKLSQAKRSLWYVVIWVIFINIPWALFNAFTPKTRWTVDWSTGQWSFVSTNNDWAVLFDPFSFGSTFDDKIIWFFKILIFAIAVVMLILAWINIITSRWKEEKVTEAKSKVIYSILALIFLWIVESWKYVAFQWSIEDWLNLFWSLANLALFLAWPVAIFFLILAWYYYITSNWDEDRVKKAKNIVINTVLATLILLASYTFLLDLATL